MSLPTNAVTEATGRAAPSDGHARKHGSMLGPFADALGHAVGQDAAADPHAPGAARTPGATDAARSRPGGPRARPAEAAESVADPIQAEALAGALAAPGPHLLAPPTPSPRSATDVAAVVRSTPSAAPIAAAGVSAQPSAKPTSSPAAKKTEGEGPMPDATPARPVPFPPTAPAELRASTPAPSTTQVAPGLPIVRPDVEVSGAVLQSAAHLKLDPGTAAAVDLHLRVRDGTLHLRVDGDAARVIEARAPELSRALAGEGLKLAPVEAHRADGGTLQGGTSTDREGRRQAWDEAADRREAPAGAPTPPPRASKPRGGDGRIDVQA